jgi:small basic protein
MQAYDEETPLLSTSRTFFNASYPLSPDPSDIHLQFCALAGIPPSTLPRAPIIPRRSLYGRALHRRDAQHRMYILTFSASSFLLLTQVVLGAVITGLGASRSSHILVTVFGALNTIIAGIVAYLKSRGQPMRARMFRDDLERVVDEIENSEVMWLGVQAGVDGYEGMEGEEGISVRSEVARLTRLYDVVVRNNTMNDREFWLCLWFGRLG